MFKIDIICIANIKNNAFADLIEMYQKRIHWPVNIIALESKNKDSRKSQEEENQKILKHLDNQAVIIVMDERGKSLPSLEFSKKMQDFAHEGSNHIQFVVGGADGLLGEIQQRADILLSFGKQTWPHALARVMLLEQIYRTQQILAGHPYHRE
ncbi:MAG: 23S rRNA (pseudouridine(1915)-N(3))-methyltransferase RlmH [Alphaproteobacteria bacterium]|nr:23S rRNA (pseudouridine(1915)-N(3))-methyltransferase RlmH [Alphaproteobacteria bacterium]